MPLFALYTIYSDRSNAEAGAYHQMFARRTARATAASQLGRACSLPSKPRSRCRRRSALNRSAGRIEAKRDDDPI